MHSQLRSTRLGDFYFSGYKEPEKYPEPFSGEGFPLISREILMSPARPQDSQDKFMRLS